MAESLHNRADELALDRYISAVWRLKWLILALTVAAAAVAWFISRNQPVLYAAVADIKIGRAWKEPLEDPYVTEETVNGGSFAAAVAAKLDAKPGQVRKNVQAQTVEGGPRRARYPILVRITATTPAADESLRLARAAAEEVISRHEKLFTEAMAPRIEQQRRLEAQVGQLKASPAAPTAFMQAETELTEVTSNNTSPTVTEKTRLLEEPVANPVARPGPWRSVALWALVAAFVGVLIAVLTAAFQPARRFTAANQ